MNDGNGELQWVVSAYIISLGAITTRDQVTVGTEKVTKYHWIKKEIEIPLNGVFWYGFVAGANVPYTLVFTSHNSRHLPRSGVSSLL